MNFECSEESPRSFDCGPEVKTARDLKREKGEEAGKILTVEDRKENRVNLQSREVNKQKSRCSASWSRRRRNGLILDMLTL